MTTNELQTLRFPANNFDKAANFKFNVKSNPIPRHGYLLKDDSTGKIFVMQCATVLQGSYTAAERAEIARMNALEALNNGDMVVVDGETYKLTIVGNYSDAGYLTKV